MPSQNGISWPLKGKTAGASKSQNGFSLPLIDDVANTPRSQNGISIPIRQYCLRVIDQGFNPIQNAIVTIAEGLASEQYISDVNGFVYVFIKAGNALAQKAGFGDGNLAYDFEGQEDACLDIQLTAITGLATQLESTTLPTLQSVQTNNFCYCAVECDYFEVVFAEVSGSSYKNDESSFLFQKLVSGDTLEYELYKSNVKVADLNDNTYGTLYDGFTAQPLYKGFILDWESVFAAFGAGYYQIRLQRTILGSSDTVNSRIFRLLPYSDEDADKTVVIKGVHTGNLVSSPLDFTDLLPGGWPIITRVDGEFYKINPELEADNYLQSSYRREQIQDKLIGNFQLNVRRVPAELANLFLDGGITLANNIIITDYNLFNAEIIREQEVYFKEPQYDPVFGQRLQDITLTFTDKVENKIKRNF